MYRTPKHIGIIPDGNRRWAIQNGLKKENGYVYGLEPALRLLRKAKKHGVEELTFYGFTTDNCKRPKEQVRSFAKACCDAVNIMESEDVSIYVAGRSEEHTSELQSPS